MKKSDPTPAPRPLDYPSPPLSPYDRPIEPFVRFAHQFRLVVRVAYLTSLGVGALAFLVWIVLRLLGVLDR